jgi:putative protease
MKDARYVAVVTAVYREALDAAVADPQGYEVRPDWWRRLEQSFSRGFTTAHLDGLHSRVRSGGRGGHRGVPVGRVESVDDRDGLVTVKLNRPVSVGDVVCLYTPWGQSEPVRVPELPRRGEGLARDGQRLVLRIRERAAVKDRLFRLSAADADSFAQDLIAGRSVLRPVRLRAVLEGRIGGPARLRLAVAGRGSDEASMQVTVESEAPLQRAQTAALSETKARAALGALGGTPYTLDALDYQVEHDAFLPVAGLKQLRRRAVAELDGLRSAARRRVSRTGRRPSVPRGVASVPGRPRASAEISVVLRLRLGEEPIQAPGVAALCLDLGGHELPERVAACIAESSRSGLPVRCRPPEVLFDADHEWWRTVAGLPWQAVYARHAAHLDVGIPAILEYPLQGLNAEPARRLRPKAVVASPEAALGEIAELAAALADARPAIAVEVLAFGRQQVLVTRDRLGLAEGLLHDEDESGTQFTLVDGKGYAFPVDAEAAGTRIFNARVTNCAPHLAELAEAGVAAAVVVQADMLPAERRAFQTGGIAALSGFAARERSTSGHLFRGVL